MQTSAQWLPGGGEAMNEDAPSLPSNRAFVVQFRWRDAALSRGCNGRVEHVSSGRAGRFESWEELREFVERVLAAETALPGDDPNGKRRRASSTKPLDDDKERSHGSQIKQ